MPKGEVKMFSQGAMLSKEASNNPGLCSVKGQKSVDVNPDVFVQIMTYM